MAWRKAGEIVDTLEAELILGKGSELVHAVEHESPERIRDEALDVAVTALRLWLGEHEEA